MDAERKAMLDRLVAEVVDERGDVAPPWARHPELPAGSIGWRMGLGEDWLVRWHHWLAAQPRDRAWRVRYLERHPPAPRTWQDLAMRVVHPMLSEDDELERFGDIVRELETLGIVGDDVAFGAWALRNDPPPPPWRIEAHGPSDTVRYGARELGLFARWAARARAEGSLSAWIDRTPAPARWDAFVAALRSGRPGAAAEGREALAVLLAAHGEPPPPWARGEPPGTLLLAHRETASYADAWAEWAIGVFDDAPSFRAYLARSSPAPAEWDAAVRRKLAWLCG